LFGFQVLGVPWVEGFTDLSLWAAVFFTALSGFIYLQRNRDLYLKDL
jgi:hypothetical protein